MASVASDSIPVATWGVNPVFARQVRELLAPKYDVVHTCTDLAKAQVELPSLFSGDATVRPANGIGSNVERAEGEAGRVPKVLIFGGGITAEGKEQLKTAINEKAGGESIKYIQVDREKMLSRLNGATPSPEVSAELAIEALEEAGIR